jgi:Carbohydrate esterase, sialic acid-specific acetylesterase
VRFAHPDNKLSGPPITALEPSGIDAARTLSMISQLGPLLLNQEISMTMTIDSGLDEGQVLQRLGSRGANARLVGTSSESGAVKATISDSKGVLKGWKARSVGQSARGKFFADLKDIPTGGPYRLKLEIGKASASREFFVGDVWIMGGQSNMEGVGDMSAPARPHPLVRVFSMRREWRLATDPLHLLVESPDACHSYGSPCTPKNGELARKKAQKGVGVGVFFGREMVKKLGVPVGLIATAHGGTSMAQWDPKLRGQGGKSLYGSMYLSWKATGQPVAGMLWYQGESDAWPPAVASYTARTKKLVAAVRRDLRQPRLPWVVVQICRVHGANDAASWNGIQEQQRLLPASIPHLETVSTIDLPLDDIVHIGAEGFPRLGQRMARAALQLMKAGEQRPPQFRDATPNRKLSSAAMCLDVRFDSVAGGLRAPGLPTGFTLVDSEGNVQPFIFKTTLHGNTVRLFYGRTWSHDLRLHYGHGIMPICNITDGRDCALPAFGPIALFKDVAFLPFVMTWKTSGIIAAKLPLEKIACPRLQNIPGATVKAYPESAGHIGFINEHALWEGHSGHAYFESSITLSEPMKLRVLAGYDGPFRLWLNGKSFLDDLKGTNPCSADKTERKVALRAGTHRITIAMDLCEGRAWGFFLRFIRDDVSARQHEAKTYARPVYSA